MGTLERLRPAASSTEWATGLANNVARFKASGGQEWDCGCPDLVDGLWTWGLRGGLCCLHAMGSVGDAYDNAMAESFFYTLEAELLSRR